MPEETKKGFRISLNLTREYYDSISRLARIDGRTRSNYVEQLVIKEVKKNAAK